MSEWVVTRELWPKQRLDLLDELLRLQQDGWRLALSSATFRLIAEVFARRMGEGVVALGTPLEVESSVFTGRLQGPVRLGAHKAEHLRKLLHAEALHAACGDSLPDEAMLELAEQPVVVYLEPKLCEQAMARDWRIIG